MQKFLFLPDPHTDFIFSIWGEEMGFVGAVALIALILLLLTRGFRVALRAPDPFGFYLAAGLTLQLAVYAAVHVAVTTGFFPTTGLPLPFISFGGSSLVMNLFTVGVLLNISRRVRAG
jgi:cell division protein FtsW